MKKPTADTLTSWKLRGELVKDCNDIMSNAIKAARNFPFGSKEFLDIMQSALALGDYASGVAHKLNEEIKEYVDSQHDN